MDADGWQVASGSGRRKSRGAVASGHGHAATASLSAESSTTTKQQPTERQVQRCCAAVDAAASELAAAPFWQHLSQQLAQLPEHLCPSKLQHMTLYGLGSLEQPGAVHIRYQLALGRLLAGLLPLLAAAEAFDPVFTALDKAALAHCGMQVMTQDEEGRRLAHQPTLFFMPHCEATLTNALLEANLAAGTLHNLVILGNRFSGYQSSWALPHRQQLLVRLPRPDTMLRLCDSCVVQELIVSEKGFPVASAFNDLGLQWFTLDWRQRLAGAAAPVPVSISR